MPPTFIETISPDQWMKKSVGLLAGMIQTCIDTRGECIIGLSGGSTPRPIYEELGQQDLPWRQVKIFLIDERYVPVGHQDSNQKLVRESLLRNAAIPGGNIFVPDTSLPLQQSVDHYARDLRKLWANHLTDVVILGIGDDGHIASLFPPLDPSLMDDSRLVANTTTDQFAIRDRITVTLNPIAAANDVVVFLRGASKKKTWDEMLASTENERRWPLKRILENEKTTVVWGP